MLDLFDKPVLDQMYEYRKDDFEQTVYDTNKEIQNIECKICDIAENFIAYLKKVILDKKQAEKAVKKFEEYQLESVDSMEFWCKTYFKLGMVEREKIRNEFYQNQLETKEQDTFLNFELNCLSEWIEAQKRKYTFDTKEYKELQNKYNIISEQYPNVIKVFEDLEAIILTQDEMKALVELREIDIEMGTMEKDLCFKLGMKEVINFN